MHSTISICWEENTTAAVKKEAKNWKDCYWVGTPDKGFLGSDSCDDNHCNTGHEVELTTSYFGGG